MYQSCFNDQAAWECRQQECKPEFKQRESCVLCYMESSIVSLSPRCCSFPFRRRKISPKSDAEENWRMEWKKLNPCWEFLGGLGLEEGFVKLNSLLLNSSSPTHCELPNSTVSSRLKKGHGGDAHAQTPTWKLNCYKGRWCFVTSSKNSISQDQ